MNIVFDAVKVKEGTNRIHLNLSLKEAKDLHYILIRGFDGLINDRTFVNELGLIDDKITQNRLDLNINIRTELMKAFDIIARLDGDD